MKTDWEQFLKDHESNKELINFIVENQIGAKKLQENQTLIYEYLNSYSLCKKQENIAKCQQEIPGYRLKLLINNNKEIITVLTECAHGLNNLNEQELSNKFLIRHYPDELLSLSWSKNFIRDSKGRQEIVNYFLKVLRQKKTDAPGLYLHGDVGVGKTYIFILLANTLINQKYTVAFISWPEFVSEFKNFENWNENQKKLEQIKKCDFLFIDDLGGELVKPWERDELLFPILNARILPLKTTFINSNYNLKSLADCYKTTWNEVENIKVKRIIERIKKLTSIIKLEKFND